MTDYKRDYGHENYRRDPERYYTDGTEKETWPRIEAHRMAEAQSLRDDAERYRWLCDGHGYFLEEEQICGHTNQKAEADAAIDAARGAK